ncbi:unnamed protein product [Calypogeia fissa]
MGTEGQTIESRLDDLKIDTSSVLDAGDPSFVQDPECQPKRKHNDFEGQALGDQIPCIDLSPLNEKDDEGMERLVKEIRTAAEEWGFFEVVNHGVPQSLVDTLEKEAMEFFSLPLEGKNKNRRSFQQPFGYFHQELTKNRKDWKEVFDFLVKEFISFPSLDGSSAEQRIRSQWPEEPAGLRDACHKYAQATEKLGFELLGLLAQSLGLAPEYFHHHFTNHTSAARLNHYPPCPIPNLVLGVGQHRDPCAITILSQDETGGLQVRRKDGEWIGVKPRKDAFVINIGDQFQVWTNKKYLSVEHQVVVNEHKKRLSLAVFMGPELAMDIFPLPELLGGESPKYCRYNYGYFISQRTAGNIEKLGKTLQIEDFEINKWVLNS